MSEKGISFMVNLLIYGAKDQARQLCYYAEREEQANVCAFVVDTEYKTISELDGHPVITFEDALKEYPPADYEFAISFAYQHMMHDRRNKFEKCKQAGYRIFTFISQNAHCYAKSVGEGTIIYPGVSIGFDTEIGMGNFFEINGTIAHNTIVGDWNFFAPGALVCGRVLIHEHNFFGAHCTVMGSAEIGNHVIVGAGAVVRNAEDYRVYLPERSKLWHGISTELPIR